MKTTVYVDGMNLYYGCLKGSRYKWLDLMKLFSLILGGRCSIETINYFTAKIENHKRQRQALYFRALEHSHSGVVKFHYGHFSRHPVTMPLAESPAERVSVIKTEEKGSDVNLAVHLLNDAWLDKYECGVIVSNDNDMAEAMKQVKKQFPEKRLGLIKPTYQKSKELSRYADFVRPIRKSALAQSQLPACIPQTTITKPSEW